MATVIISLLAIYFIVNFLISFEKKNNQKKTDKKFKAPSQNMIKDAEFEEID